MVIKVIYEILEQCGIATTVGAKYDVKFST